MFSFDSAVLAFPWRLGGFTLSTGLRAGVLALLCACLFAACAADHPCTRELCDGLDNDCDGKSDEDFRDANARYADAENCGGCGLRCSEVFPSAAATECALEDELAICRITACREGQKLAGAGACIPDVPVVCLPCELDDECALRSPEARCLEDAAGSKRCGQACAGASDCPTGFVCTKEAGGRDQCRPRSGACDCDAEMQGANFACELASEASKRVCPGLRRCSESGLSACEPALKDACNGLDDDCDGKADEDFTDLAGRYVGPMACGSCERPCVPAGPHVRAICVPDESSAACERSCEPGFVDVDGFAANGCECQLSVARAPVISGDQDCDGVIDPVPQLIFVSGAGDDAHAGTSPETAVRSLSRGLLLGADFARNVVIARGIYRERVTLLAGVSIVGGYSPDFREHDAALYPVLIEAPLEDPGAPVLRCQDIDSTTYIADLTIAASDAATAGQGSTAVFLANCSEAVELDTVTVLAARGANGARGADSSARLAEVGLGSLSELAGVSGGSGEDGGASCGVVAAGSGGQKSCAGMDVSGGAGGAARCAALSCSNTGDQPCGNAGCTDFTRMGVCDIAAARAAAVPNPNPEDGRGPAPGRRAEATFDAPTNHRVCSFCDDNPSLPRVGGDGADGQSGLAGQGGSGCNAAAVLDDTGRVQANTGEAGEAGSHGSGGGGGSAGAGYAVIAATSGMCSSVPGAAGGGAGSGGCGAPAAAGGGGGGVSAGIVIRVAPGRTRGPRLRDVRIVTASGGDGGDGGVGAAGGGGGSGGLGGTSSFWCARNGGRGGDGGVGGDGGGGGGGCGGSSFGIYVRGNARGYADELRESAEIEIAGSAGRAGRGGFSPTHAGDHGAVGEVSAVTLVAD